MFKLDNQFLTSMGLGSLPVEEKNKLLQVIYERLEMNVGMRLAEKMTDDQLVEFESFIDKSDEAGALRWLETNFPNYKQVVAEELEKLKAEVTASAPQILASVQADPPAPSSVPPSAPAPGAYPPNPTEQPGYQPQPGSIPAQPDDKEEQPTTPPIQPPTAPSAPWDQPPPGPGAQPPAGFPPQ